MVLDRIREQLVRGLPHQIGRLCRPSISLHAGDQKPVDHRRSHVLKQCDLDMLVGVLVVPGRCRLSPRRRSGQTRQKALTGGAEEYPQPAEIILVGLEGTSGPELSAKRFQDRRQTRLAGDMEVTERQVILQPLPLCPGHPFVRGLE